MSAESMSLLCTPQKTSFYACFIPQNKPKSQKSLVTVYTISHGFLISAHMIKWGGGGRENATVGTKQSKNSVAAIMWPFISRVRVSQTSEDFIEHCFYQDVTYFVKYDSSDFS